MDVTLLSAIEQLDLIRRGKISSAELADETLLRIRRLDPVLHAFAECHPERVRAAAAEPKAGALSGLPMTVKSSLAVRGYRLEIGSRLREGIVATSDAQAVGALRGAGAVVLGTTNCPEFLMAYETDNQLYGATCNPWDIKRSAGGSSGGEAAAIAAGLSSGGVGSDSGGSVREPAHFAGICALKPTPGRVSAIGHYPPCLGPFSSLGAVGPMGRTAADVDLFFQVLCQAACTGGGSAPLPYKAVTEDEARCVSVGWFEDDALVPVTEETRQCLRAAVNELARIGFEMHPFRPAGLETARKLWRTFFLRCGRLFYEPTIHGKEDGLSPIFQEFLREAERDPPLTAETLLGAWAEMDELRIRFFTEMEEHRVLILPVCAVPAFHHGERTWNIEGKPVNYWDAMRYTQWFNVLALPAAVVPVGISSEGLPIGVQIVGRPYEDELVLAVAKLLDKAFGYRIPPIALQQ